jgi:hypothetical protein
MIFDRRPIVEAVFSCFPDKSQYIGQPQPAARQPESNNTMAKKINR